LTQGEQRKELLTNAGLRAGEIECALADLGLPVARQAESLQAESLTDALAQALVSASPDLQGAFARLRASDLPEWLTVKSPEGFAYYALDPLRYADIVRGLSKGPAFIVGIRSIGTVLSAVCAAALRCERMTVRPAGHPYDRELRLSDEQRDLIRAQIARGAHFFVVDEGPGLSGSSFLATAEALEREGVQRERLTMVGSHDFDAVNLVTRDAPSRWRRYRFIAVPPASAPHDTRPFIDWDWRRESRRPETEWPATWSQLTPPKYISIDGGLFWKFEGLGRTGDQARMRAQVLAAARFSPDVAADTHGFTAYEYLQGRALSAGDWSPQLAQRVREYLAFRKTECAVRPDATQLDATQLREMVVHNVRALLDAKLQDYALDVVYPCVCDGRLMPHEWVRTEDGRTFKTDATMHGDDHFYPGPCDIAWDIAGALIEWSLDVTAERRFLLGYSELTRDSHVRDRLPPYKVAYSAFRAAYARMAASAMPGTAEAARFDWEFTRYMDVLRNEAQPFLRPKKAYSIA
jgi:hypothetical protein